MELDKLPIEIVCGIAGQHPLVWLGLAQTYKRFLKYIQGEAGYRLAFELFGKCENEFDQNRWHIKIYHEPKVDEHETRWYLNGRLHRIGGPAIKNTNGDCEWYVNGQLHRTDGPAVESSGGTRSWYLYGRLHRIGGPSIECVDGTKFWHINGQLLRTSGFSGIYYHGPPPPQEITGARTYDRRTVIEYLQSTDGRRGLWLNGVHMEMPQPQLRVARQARLFHCFATE